MAATPSVNNTQIDAAATTKPVFPDLIPAIDAALLFSAKSIYLVSKEVA
jgi:hypothetical protein